MKAQSVDSAERKLEQFWASLPAGARAAFEEQWAGVAAGGLPCGSCVIDATGNLVARGRNHVYDAAGAIETRARYALQQTRLAHAEMNALAGVPTAVDHAGLTLWTTQHPCSMCAAALQFIGVGRVCYVADDPSDFSSSGQGFVAAVELHHRPNRPRRPPSDHQFRRQPGPLCSWHRR